MMWMLVWSVALGADRFRVDALCGDLRVEGGAKQLQVDGKPVEGQLHLGPHDCRSVVLQVPDGLSLEIDTVSAGVVLHDVRGEVEFESASGALVVSGDAVPARLTATSVSGSLKVTVADGGQVELETVSGAITVVGGPAKRVEVDTVSGAQELALSLHRDGRLEAQSHNGTVHLRLPSPPARVEAESFSGHVRNAFDTLVPRGPSVEIETFSADIIVEPWEKK